MYKITCAVNFYSHVKYLHWREVIRCPCGSLEANSAWLQPTFSNWQSTFTTQPRTSNNPTAANHSSRFKQARLCHRAALGVDSALVRSDICLVVAGRGFELLLLLLLQHVWLQLFSNFTDLKRWADRLCVTVHLCREVRKSYLFMPALPPSDLRALQ